MDKIIYNGRINGEFEGFDDNKVFWMENGTCWMQDQYEYWYHYCYRPVAVITLANCRYYLNVEGKTIPVRQINCVAESRIDGEFRGWEGSTRYKLRNGQCWEQTRYKYQYKYSYCPHVEIFDIGGTYIMSVAGTTMPVKRIC